MKAPDKIYLWETLIVNGGYDPAWHKNSLNEGDVEYIRKDALIEWANSWLAFKKSGIVLDDGFSYAMEELIKKLNSI